MTALTTATLPQLTLRSLDATWTYARWQELPYDGNRYEVLDGVLYLTTSPSNFHQWIVTQLLYLIGLPAHSCGLAYPFVGPIGLLIPDAQPAQPDFLLVRRERAAIIRDGRIRGAPDLIVEILSPSNPDTDTDTKLRLYARAGVPEYWIIRPATRDVLVHWAPEASGGTYTHTRHYPPDARLDSPTLPLGLTVAALFADAPDTTL